MKKLVLDVGQCGFDHMQIAKICLQFGAQTRQIHTENELFDTLKKEAPNLIFINRILDSNGANGIKIIKNLKSDDNTKYLPVLLISNYAQAQHEAVSLGALQGFGKNELHTDGTTDLLSKLLSS